MDDAAGGRENPFASVVIPTTGRRDSLAAVVGAVEASLANAGWPHEVLVEFDRAGAGASRTRNAAGRRARGDIIAFLDDDIVVDPDWGERVGLLAREPGAVLWAGALRAPGTAAGAAGPSREEQEAGLKDFGAWPRELGPRDYGAAGHLLVSRAAWNELRGFSESFGNPGVFSRNEDVELFCRARRQGMSTRWEPSLRATHLFPHRLGPAECCEQGRADFAIDLRYHRSAVLRNVVSASGRVLIGSKSSRRRAAGYFGQAAAAGLEACRAALRRPPG